jgi:hypothetical protein
MPSEPGARVRFGDGDTADTADAADAGDGGRRPSTPQRRHSVGRRSPFTSA